MIIAAVVIISTDLGPGTTSAFWEALGGGKRSTLNLALPTTRIELATFALGKRRATIALRRHNKGSCAAVMLPSDGDT